MKPATDYTLHLSVLGGHDVATTATECGRELTAEELVWVAGADPVIGTK
jgi:hypothetical protein